MISGKPTAGAVPEVFDRAALRRHRTRALGASPDRSALIEEVADRLADRLDDVRRSFPQALILGRHRGQIARHMAGRGAIGWQVETDVALPLVRTVAGRAIVADEEALPFKDATFDLIVSCFSLHWVNDLPGALVQIRRALKPDGLFLAALPGGDTLPELRRVLADAEIANERGLGPRVSPFIDVRDAGHLLQRAGFALPVVDCHTITALYGDPLSLLLDLRGMGETNSLTLRRRTFSRRATLFDALARYNDLRPGPDMPVPATFQILFLTGWAPHAGQPRPLRRGSGQTPLGQALEADPGDSAGNTESKPPGKAD
jgi:NADH dehydrogenase [ubiquinone] 1 alpha subcomplex assembly factor 5